MARLVCDRTTEDYYSLENKSPEYGFSAEMSDYDDANHNVTSLDGNRSFVIPPHVFQGSKKSGQSYYNYQYSGSVQIKLDETTRTKIEQEYVSAGWYRTYLYLTVVSRF